MSVMILIPVRMAASRLPNKPLAQIHNVPMIIHVMRRAQEADCGDIVIAAGDKEIADCVHDYGGKAILTDVDLPSGTDRIYQALQRATRDDVDYVMNLQGDLPNISPKTIRGAVELGQSSECRADIITPVAEMSDPQEISNENVVKAALMLEKGQNHARALYFSRIPIPFHAPIYYHHVGLYLFTRSALEKFVKLPQTLLEKTERLEQLRGLQAGMHIEAFLTDQIPLGVDTQEDLDRMRQLMQPESL